MHVRSALSGLTLQQVNQLQQRMPAQHGWLQANKRISHTTQPQYHTCPKNTLPLPLINTSGGSQHSQPTYTPAQTLFMLPTHGYSADGTSSDPATVAVHVAAQNLAL